MTLEHLYQKLVKMINNLLGTTASDEPEMYIPSVIGAPKFNGRIHGGTD